MSTAWRAATHLWLNRGRRFAKTTNTFSDDCESDDERRTTLNHAMKTARSAWNTVSRANSSMFPAKNPFEKLQETAVLVRMKDDVRDKYLKTLERVKGIEPSYSAWKAAALPLSYTRARQIN
jgi:hypothetical protein